MKKSLTRILAAVVAVIMTAAVVSCQAEEKTIRIGYLGWLWSFLYCPGKRLFF